MIYLNGRDILVINARVIDATHGSKGVRDQGLLSSIVEKPKSAFDGQEMYPSIFEKAAVYLEALVKYHVFVDGNKRTGLVVSARFLFLNGYMLTASNEDAEHFVLSVATSRMEIKEIADWFKKHSKKVK